MIASKFRPACTGAGIALILTLAPAAAQTPGPVDRLTQFFGRSPPADVDDEGPSVRADTGASVRIDRLENQLRALTGQIEQMQFSMRQLQDQLRKAQQDADFRPQDGQGPRPVRRADEGLPPVVAQTTPSLVATPSATPVDPARLRRGDAFDPATQPGAPGAPRQIGTLPGANVPQTPIAQSTRLPGGPVATDGAPMDLSGGRIASNGSVIEPSSRGAIVGTPLPSAGQPVSPSVVPGVPSAPGVATTPGGTVIASHEPFSPKEEFEVAAGYLKGGQYEAAEKGYASFLQKNPKNRLVPEAVFSLGETYFQRGRHREATEQYLKILTTYPTSGRAAEATLRLGQSLVPMGAKEQACASFNEIARKYPNASSTVKASAEREVKKNQC